MKQKWFPIACAAIMLLSLVGCGSKTVATKDVDLSSTVAAIEAYDNGNYSSQSIGDLKTVYDVDSGDVKQFSAKTKNGAAIVLIEAISDDAANRCAQKLNSYQSHSGHGEQEKVTKIGNYVALFYSSNGKADQMAECFTSFVEG
ncbi:MAG: hypothetical protein PUC32_03020 [Oscillospiraceae bacterium]|nr:hypothetical protein [Oscillospiraceae bacterium]